MNSLEFKVLWTDDADGMLQLAVEAASSTDSAYHETYVFPEGLAVFAAEITSFPRAADAEVVLECGSKAPNWHDYFRMRVALVKVNGHSALELESEVRKDPPGRPEVHFFIPGMPADFNRMGAELIEWLADTSVPWRFEWRSGL